jgi:hypothetical protein
MIVTAKVIRVPAERTKSGRKLDLPMSSFVHQLLVARRAVGRARFVFFANSKSGRIAEPKFPLGKVAARRTFVTVAESAATTPLALKMLVNHAVGNDVTSGYVVMTTEQLRESAQRVCDRMAELCGIPAIGIRAVEPAGA